jgi:hypothetical protein
MLSRRGLFSTGMNGAPTPCLRIAVLRKSHTEQPPPPFAFGPTRLQLRRAEALPHGPLCEAPRLKPGCPSCIPPTSPCACSPPAQHLPLRPFLYADGPLSISSYTAALRCMLLIVSHLPQRQCALASMYTLCKLYTTMATGCQCFPLHHMQFVVCAVSWWYRHCGGGANREEGYKGTGGGGGRGKDEVKKKMEWSVSNKAGIL